MSLLFFYRLSFGFRSENSFGKEKDRSFWKLTKPQPYTLCYFNVSTIALTWTSVKKDGLLNKKDLNLNPVSPFTVLMRTVVTPFYCAPLHHIQSVVSNLPGTKLITLGLCSQGGIRTHNEQPFYRTRYHTSLRS